MGHDNFEKKDVEFCTNFSNGFLSCASKSDFVFEISGKIWPGHNLRNCCKNSGCVIEAFREHFCFSNVLVTILCATYWKFEDSFIPSKLGQGCAPLFADVQINKLIHIFYRAGKGKRDQFRTNADKREYGILHARRQARTQPLQDGRRKSFKKGKPPHQRRQAWIRNSACTRTSVNIRPETKPTFRKYARFHTKKRRQNIRLRNNISKICIRQTFCEIECWVGVFTPRRNKCIINITRQSFVPGGKRKKGPTSYERRQAWIRNSACTPTSVNTAQKRKQPPENTHASTRKNDDKTFDFAIMLPRFVYDKSSAKSNAGSGFSV